MPSLAKLFSFANSLRPYAALFDPRSLRSFRAILDVLLGHAHGRQPEFAAKAEKSLSALQYFFRYARWCADAVNEKRLSIIHRRRETHDRKSDVLILDGTPMEKDKDCASEGIGKIFDNRRKAVVTGYEAFGAAVLTAKGIVYPVRLMIFLPQKWLSQWHAWIHFLRWCLARTQAWLVLIDRGFRNASLLAEILRRKREFLVRASRKMPLWIPLAKKEAKRTKRGRKKRFPNREKKSLASLLDHRLATATEKGKLWLFPDVIVDAWKNDVKRCCSVIVYHRDGFRDPLVLVFSRKDITIERALEIVGMYHKRWNIEQCFLELKTSFQLEGFRLTSIEAVERWFVVCLVAHSFLQNLHLVIPTDSLLARFIAWILKICRNIRERTLLSLKIFLEMCQSDLYGLQRRFTLFLAKNYESHL